MHLSSVEVAPGAVGDPEALADIGDLESQIAEVEKRHAYVVTGNERNRAKARATLAKLDADSAARSRDLADGGSPPSRNPKAETARLDAEELIAACDLREYGDGPEDLPALDAKLSDLRERLRVLVHERDRASACRTADELGKVLAVAGTLAVALESLTAGLDAPMAIPLRPLNGGGPEAILRHVRNIQYRAGDPALAAVDEAAFPPEEELR